MAVRSSSGMKTSLRRVITTSTPGSRDQQLLEAERNVQHQFRFVEPFTERRGRARHDPGQ